jgi:hypothetical protein
MNLSGIRPGDIVELDGPAAKGSDGPVGGLARYHALVLEGAAGGQLRVRRLAGGTTFYVRARLVVGHWRRSRSRLRPAREPERATAPVG